tara:strand:- start:1134 stop:1559 length:426 start_codon:yes stop_codon:yes gene_type:complete
MFSMKWMLLPLKRYADFQGRSRRKEFWMFMLLIVIVYLAVFTFIVADEEVSGGAGLEGFTGLLGVAVALLGIGILIPSLAVQVRRFHDQDHSGWFVLLSFIPYIGGLIVLVFMCLPGTRGPNRFGPDPKEMEADALTETFR